MENHLPPELVFRRSRDGYDRRDVDRYVYALIAERDDLRNRVADLESTIAATTDYLQSRRGRREPAAPVPSAPVVVAEWHPPVAIKSAPPHWVGAHPVRTMRAIDSTRAIKWSAAAIGILVVLGSTYAYRRGRDGDPLPGANAVVVSAAAATSPARQMTASVPTAPPVTARALVQADFVVALATQTTCWVAMNIDGQPRTERVLHRDEQFSVHWSQEIVLRVGDAGAVSVRINGRPAKPLGPAGQPVTVRITPSNLEQFLAPTVAK